MDGERLWLGCDDAGLQASRRACSWLATSTLDLGLVNGQGDIRVLGKRWREEKGLKALAALERKPLTSIKPFSFPFWDSTNC